VTAHSGNVSSTRQYSITGHATEKSSISIWGWGWVIEDRVSFRDRLGFKVKLGLKLRKGQMLGGGGVNVPQSYRPSHGPAAAGMQPDIQSSAHLSR